jgi:predicted nucleic acid-binding protein
VVIVDSSVWIDYYGPRANEHTVWLERKIGRESLGLTDQILCEVLQGTRTESNFVKRLQELSEFDVFNTGGEELAILSAHNYRHLRAAGITIRTAVDCLIATFCLARGHTLLHRDRDFDSFEKHLGLSVIHPRMH